MSTNWERVTSAADRIKQAMNETGKKQTDLVEATGLSKGAVSRYVSGDREPRSDAIHKLAVALDVSEMWLWGYDAPKGRTPEQKKNDDLVRIIAKLRTEPELLEVVSIMSDAQLSAEQYALIKQLLAALAHQ